MGRRRRRIESPFRDRGEAKSPPVNDLKESSGCKTRRLNSCREILLARVNKVEIFNSPPPIFKGRGVQS
jgi:hypothetical protein